MIETALTGGRRLSNSNQSCAIHRVIRNSAGAFVGQTIGPGVEVAGVSGATICLNPSVPDAERCSAYTIKDVVSVSSTGAYSAPLEKTVTIDPQGKFCISNTAADNSMHASFFVGTKESRDDCVRQDG